MAERRLLTIQAAAERLDVAETTLIHLTERGLLDLYRAPGERGSRARRYVLAEAVEALRERGDWRLRAPRQPRKPGKS